MGGYLTKRGKQIRVQINWLEIIVKIGGEEKYQLSRRGKKLGKYCL